MSEKLLRCYRLADGHAEVAGADAYVFKRAIATDLLPAVACVCRAPADDRP